MTTKTRTDVTIGARVQTWWYDGNPLWQGEGVVTSIESQGGSDVWVTVAFDDALGRRKGNFHINSVSGMHYTVEDMEALKSLPPLTQLEDAEGDQLMVVNRNLVATQYGTQETLDYVVLPAVVVNPSILFAHEAHDDEIRFGDHVRVETTHFVDYLPRQEEHVVVGRQRGWVWLNDYRGEAIPFTIEEVSKV